MKLQAIRDIAFGNGTRPRGFDFGQIEINDDSRWIDVHRESLTTRPADMETASCEPAESVTPVEFANAIRNVGTCIEMIDEGVDVEDDLPPGEWREILVAESDLSKSVKEKFAAAGIVNLGDIETHTTEHQGFEGTDLVKQQETAVIAYLAKYLAPAG